MKLLCCDGPFNGTYQEVNTDRLEDGDILFLPPFYDSHQAIYTLETWPTGERVLINTRSKAEVEAFANDPYDWEAKADFTFPLTNIIHDAVMDAEV